MQREREETRDIVNSETKMIQVLFQKMNLRRKNETKMIITCSCYSYGAGRDDFDAGNIYYKGQ
jgi:hypothetical protein